MLDLSRYQPGMMAKNLASSGFAFVDKLLLLLCHCKLTMLGSFNHLPSQFLRD